LLHGCWGVTPVLAMLVAPVVSLLAFVVMLFLGWMLWAVGGAVLSVQKTEPDRGSER
jgi:hypothetical protein